MSSVSYMEKLLEGVEVEWKALGEVAIIGTGSRNTNEAVLDGQYPFFVRSQEPRTIDDFEFDETAIITAGDGVGVGKVFHYISGKYALHQRAYRIVVTDNNVKSKFLFHFIRNNFARYLTTTSVHASVTSLRRPMFEKYPIPIPPLAIQAEIVRILDTFTGLTAELTAELTARKEQYNYYRDQLLTFAEGEVEWKMLGEVSLKVSSGGTPLSTREDYYGGDIPWLRTQEVLFNEIYDTDVKITELAVKNSSAKWIPANCVIVAISGATAARSAINKIPLTTNQHCCNLEINPECANYRYVFHWVCKEHDKLKALGQGARADLNAGIIKNYPIPIPYANDPERSLAEQARIVAILDKFDALTNSISEGLPREIELRQQQYEYYREQLLSFPQFPSSGGVPEGRGGSEGPGGAKGATAT